MFSFKKIISGLFATTILCGSALAGDKVVHVYSWPGFMPQSALDAFTKETGIAVEVTPYDSVEAAETKMLAGGSGFDLVLTAGFTIPQLIQAKALAELDHSKMPNIGNLDADFLKNKLSKLDPTSKYSVPVDIGVTTIAINEDKVRAILGKDAPLDTLGLLFDPVTSAKLKECGISFLDSGLEVTGLAFLYNHAADQFHPTQAELDMSGETLKAVAGNAKYFDNLRYVDDLANGNLCVAMAWNNDILRAGKIAIDAGKPVNLKTIYAKEGALLWSDHLVIPVDAPNAADGLALMDYLLRGDSAAAFTNGLALATPNTAGKELIDPVFANNEGVYPPKAWLDSIMPNDTFTQDVAQAAIKIYARAKAGN